MLSADLLLTSLLSWANYVVHLGVLGFCLFTFWMKSAGFTPRALSIKLASLLAFLGIVLTSFSFFYLSFQLSGDWLTAIDPAMLSMLWDSSPGTETALNCAAFMLFFVGHLFKRLRTASFILVILMLASSKLSSGHVNPSSLGWPITMALVVHLCLVSFWAVFVVYLLGLLRADEGRTNRLAKLSTRFGRDARIWLPFVIASGLTLAYFLVGRWEALTQTLYGQMLLVKIAMVLALFVCAWVNKRVFVPQLDSNFSDVSSKFRLVLGIELSLFLSVLFITAMLTSGLPLPGGNL